MSARLRLGLVVLAIVLVGAALRPAVSSSGPLYEVAKELVVGILFVIAGLAGWTRRPDSGTGPLMTAAGLVWLLARVLIWNDTGSASFTVGLILVLAPIAFVAHLAVAFPSGRISTGVERVVVVSAYGVILGGVAFLELDDCAGCPTNLLAVDGQGGAGLVAARLAQIATLASIAAFVVTLADHWRRGTRATRRMLVPVLPTAWLYAAVSAAFILVDLGVPLQPGRALDTTEYVATLAIPVAFLGGLLRSRLARADVGTLVVELSDGSDDELRGALAKALRDPTVEVAYWRDDQLAYRDAEGGPVDLPAEDGSRAVARIERNGQQVGALIHDPALLEDPALLDAVCAAAGLALENQRLHAQVLHRLDDVRTSRSRIVEAGDAERRRIERNLHDGAQQRLVTLAMALRMARDRIGAQGDASLVALLGDASEELNQALRELRELAAGLHPTILSEEGLDAALESLTERSLVPVELDLAAMGHLAAPVEAAAYYVVSEALTNAAKHAHASHATVRTCRVDHRLHVEVTDDGVGGAEVRPGSGLEGLSDRVEALGGDLSVDSPCGAGTRLEARIPCVILADDATLVRQGLARLLADSGFDVVAELGDADELLARVTELRPDVVVLDVRMPPTHTVEGLVAALDVKRHHPDVGVMVLSQHLETRYAVQLLSSEVGGVGYLLKERVADIAEFADALRRVAEGGFAIDPEVVNRLIDQPRRSPVNPLSPREREVLAHLAEGRSNQAIAQHLFINAKTVESHVAAIFTKLGLLPEPAHHRRVLAALTHLQLRAHDPVGSTQDAERGTREEGHRR